jgi:hypothetical protein
MSCERGRGCAVQKSSLYRVCREVLGESYMEGQIYPHSQPIALSSLSHLWPLTFLCCLARPVDIDEWTTCPPALSSPPGSWKGICRRRALLWRWDIQNC